MREVGPAPMLSRYAVVSLTASMSRKSRRSVVGLCSFVHVLPPFSLRRIVLPEPLAQTTRSLTALTPRNRAVTPDCWIVQEGAATTLTTEMATTMIRMNQLFRAPNDVACLHHELHAACGGNIFRRIAGHGDQIGLQALGHPSDLVVQVQHARVDRS